MEISLEKIELVKDRTGVSYKEAKEALIKADGSVVDAIIMIEDEIDLTPKSKAGDQAYRLIERLKQLIKKGNISKIVVKKDNETVLNIPVNIGILSAIWVFWPTLIATILALGMRCSIELIKDNGEVVSLSNKAVDTLGDMKESCSVIADDLKGKSTEAFTQVKDKASNVISKVKAGAVGLDTDDIDEKDLMDQVVDDDIDIEIEDDYYEDDDYFNFDDYEETDDIKKEESSDMENQAHANESNAPLDHEDIAISEPEAFESAHSDDENDIKEGTGSEEAPADSIDDNETTGDLDEIQKAGERFEETISDYKKKKGKFRFFD